MFSIDDYSFYTFVTGILFVFMILFFILFGLIEYTSK